MAFIYLAAGFIILCLHAEQVPAAFVSIFVEAFAPEGVSGGVIGAMIIGLQRAVYSNEAGIGSAAIAHSAVKTREPASEGLVALLERLSTRLSSARDRAHRNRHRRLQDPGAFGD